MGYDSVADNKGLSSFHFCRCWLPNLRNHTKLRENSN